MSRLLRRLFPSRRRGQTTAEYAIIVALIAVSSIAIILIFGNQIRALFRGEAERLAGSDTDVTIQTGQAAEAETTTSVTDF